MRFSTLVVALLLVSVAFTAATAIDGEELREKRETKDGEKDKGLPNAAPKKADKLSDTRYTLHGTNLK